METWVLAVVLAVGLIAITLHRRRAAGEPVDGELLPRARDGHYLFAHRVLPGMAHSRPDVLDLLRGPDGDDFLRHVWREVNASTPEPVPPGGLGRTVEQVGELEVLLVRLPTPKLSPEAAFVAIVPTPERLRVLTLELLAEPRPRPRAPARWVVCEWSADGTHGNFGVGIDCTPAAFLAIIGELLGEQR